MMEFQEKRKLKRILYSKTTLVIFLVLIVFLSNAVFKVYKKHGLTMDNLSKTAASLEGLQARERMLSAEIERLKTETGVEQEIREKFNLVKEGEEVIMVVDKNPDNTLGSKSTPIGFWQKVLDWLR